MVRYFVVVVVVSVSVSLFLPRNFSSMYVSVDSHAFRARVHGIPTVRIKRRSGSGGVLMHAGDGESKVKINRFSTRVA